MTVRVLARYFEFSERGATLAGEVRGGLTTFMVMAYIIFVPSPTASAPASSPIASSSSSGDAALM